MQAGGQRFDSVILHKSIYPVKDVYRGKRQRRHIKIRGIEDEIIPLMMLRNKYQKEFIDMMRKTEKRLRKS